MKTKYKSQSFEGLKKEIEYKLKEIRDIQDEIKDSLHKTKELPFMVPKMAEVTAKINNLKEEIASKTNLHMNKVMHSRKENENNDLITLQKKLNMIFKQNKS